jgi:hypothetical protein
LKIPQNLNDRESLIDEVVRECEQTQQDRLAICQALRNYALFGTNTADIAGVKYNEIEPTIDLLASFLYGQEGVQFSIKWGASVPEEQAVYGETMRKKAHEVWGDTGTDVLFGDAVWWSLVFNSSFIKTIYNGGLRTYIVHPYYLGVYREDVPKIDDQEAIVHTYYATLSGLRSQTKILGPEKQGAILSRVSTLGPTDDTNPEGTLMQIIARGQIGGPGGVTGNVNQQDSRNTYRPSINPQMVQMQELWLWDDSLDDYRVFTIANPGVVIFDRKGADLCTKGEHPFVKITPLSLPDYFWGKSLTQALVPIQDWHEGHANRVDMVFRRTLRPSRAFTGPGWTQLSDEKMMALDREGGFVTSSVPGAKMDIYKPEVDLAAAQNYLQMIENKFNKTAGLADIMRAEGTPGVRSMEHASVLARMGSARIKKSALALEDSAEKLITLMMKIQQDHDKDSYLDEDKKEFYLSQVDRNYTIKVSGHSLSPVFVEDTRQEAKELVQMNAMTRGRYIDQTQPPMAEELKRDLQKIEQGEAKAAQQKAGLEMLKVASKLK